MKAKFCQNCIDKKQNYGNYVTGFYGGSLFNIPTDNKCLFCNSELKESNILCNELEVLDQVSSDLSFFEAMIELKEKDPIEFQLKLSQFKTQTQQQESVRVMNDNRPKCPTCNSTNIKKISVGKKAVGGFMFGLLSSDVRKTMCCNNCGYKW